MNTLDFIVSKYQLNLSQSLPIEIPGTGRNDLAMLFSELGFRAGVEIGTEKGEYAEVICQENPEMLLYCIDPWTCYDGNLGYKEEVTQEMFDSFRQEARERLATYRCELIQDYSMPASKRFEDNSLDFVYIDGNHRLEYVIQDIVEWSQKVKIGGVVAGHDYIRYTKQQHSHIVEAVKAYTQAYRISPWFVLGRKEKLPSEIRDKYRSWMWIKE